jgi:hypothetical protein
MMFPFLFAGAHNSSNGIFSQPLSGFSLLLCAAIGSISVRALPQSLEHTCLLVILTATVSTVVLMVVLVVAPMVVAVVLTRIRIFRHHVYVENKTETNDHCFIINDKFLPNYHRMSVPELTIKVIVCIRQPSISPSSSEYAILA